MEGGGSILYALIRYMERGEHVVCPYKVYVRGGACCMPLGVYGKGWGQLYFL